VRFALSAVAAVSGLFLLALAFYGQPAVYLREARDQWDELMDRPVAHAPAVPNSNSEERAAQTLHDAAPLSEALAERQGTAQLQGPEVALSAPSEPASGPRATSPSPGEVLPLPAGSAPPVASASPPPQPETSQLTPPASGVGVERAPTPVIRFPPQDEAGIEAATAPPEPAEQNALKPGRAGSEQTKSQQSQPEPEKPRSEPASLEAGKSQQAKAQQARPEPPKPEAVRREQAKSEPPKPEQPKSDPPKSEPKPTVANKTLLAQKGTTVSPPLPPQPPVQPPPLQQPPLQPPPPSQPPLQLQALSRQPPLSPPPQQSTIRQDGDDTQSVLARLRQLSPPTATAPQADTSDAKSRQTPSSPLPRLNSARVALASGQIEEARRLLQQVQLQLVFGPIDGQVEAPQAASRGAIDVARALDALSANDVSLSRRYIDVAVGDLSGNPTNPPIQQSDRRVSGYAPAYPPR
jgi:hypothetical protein